MIVVIRARVFEIYHDEMLNIILNIIYLVMWTLLKMKTSNRNINDIERVTKVYCYVIASLEINVMIVLILYGVHILITSSENFLGIGIINVTNIGLCFAFLKIYGLMLKKSKWFGIYLGIRYALFNIFLIALIIIIIDDDLVSVPILISSSMVFHYLIIDIGLTVILHSVSLRIKRMI